MATTTFIQNVSVTAATTETDQLAGTAVATAGPSGKVYASVTATDSSGNIPPAGTFVTLVGRESGVNVVPDGSGAVGGDYAAHGRVVFFGRVRPNEPLALTLTAPAAAAVQFSVMVKTE